MSDEWVHNPQCGTLGCLADHRAVTAHEFDAAMQEQIVLSEEIVAELIFEEVTCEDAT